MDLHSAWCNFIRMLSCCITLAVNEGFIPRYTVVVFPKQVEIAYNSAKAVFFYGAR